MISVSFYLFHVTLTMMLSVSFHSRLNNSFLVDKSHYQSLWHCDSSTRKYLILRPSITDERIPEMIPVANLLCSTYDLYCPSCSADPLQGLCLKKSNHFDFAVQYLCLFRSCRNVTWYACKFSKNIMGMRQRKTNNSGANPGAPIATVVTLNGHDGRVGFDVRHRRYK
jgi:hypothetical protein